MAQRKSFIPSCFRLINAIHSSILLVSNLVKWSFPWIIVRLLPPALTELWTSSFFNNLLFPQKYTNLARVPTRYFQVLRLKKTQKRKERETAIRWSNVVESEDTTNWKRITPNIQCQMRYLAVRLCVRIHSVSVGSEIHPTKNRTAGSWLGLC